MSRTVEYVGRGPVKRFDQGAVQWPDNAQAGDLAFIIATSFFPRYGAIRGIKHSSGWASVHLGSLPGVSWVSPYESARDGYVWAFWRIVGTNDIDSPVKLDYHANYSNLDKKSQVQIFCFRNVAYVGRYGRGRIRVSAEGGIAAAVGDQFLGTNVQNIVDDLNEAGFGYNIGKGNHFAPSNYIRQWGFELVPQPGPSAPTLVEPVDGSEITEGSDVALKWVHNGYGEPQEAFQVQTREVGGSPEWKWVAYDGILKTVQQNINSSDPNITILSNQFSTAAQPQWRAKTRTDVWSDWSSSSLWSFVGPPVVEIDEPSTTISEELSFVVKWTTTPFAGRSQQSYRVKVQGPDVSYDSGNQLGERQELKVGPLYSVVNNEDYTILVTIAQSGGASATASVVRKIKWAVPATPTIAVQQATRGIKIAVGSDADTTLEIRASDPAGDWRKVAEGVVVPVGESVEIVDVLAPYKKEITYQVRASKDLDGVLLPTEWVSSSPITNIDNGMYIVLADDLEDWVSVFPYRDTNRKFIRGGAVNYPLAGAAMVDYGPMQKDSGTLEVMTDTAAEAESIYVILTSSAPLWLRWPPDNNVDVPPTRIAVEPKNLERQRSAQLPVAIRIWTIPWVEQPEDERGE